MVFITSFPAVDVLRQSDSLSLRRGDMGTAQ